MQCETLVIKMNICYTHKKEIHMIGEGVKEMKELTVDAVVGNIETITDFVNAELELLDCPLKVQIQIDVAIDELSATSLTMPTGISWARRRCRSPLTRHHTL